MERTLRLLTLLALAGCGGQVAWDGSTPSAGGGTGVDVGPVTVVPPTFDGLPCAVKGVLQNRCTGCHGVTLGGGAPYGLTTRAELALVAPAPYDGGTRADRCLVRMAAPSAPMPPAPSGLATPAELATLASWVDAGMPAGSCGTPAVVCSSGSRWNGGESERMAPGEACLACHRGEREAPRDAFMGTVYRGYHEADDCYAAAPTSLTVDILDSATGAVVLSFPVDTVSGNFRSRGQAWTARSYRAQVRNAAGAVRQMMNPVASGDCNSCHTEQGQNGAPGRIVWPD